jgi:hypothetical protein
LQLKFSLWLSLALHQGASRSMLGRARWLQSRAVNHHRIEHAQGLHLAIGQFAKALKHQLETGVLGGQPVFEVPKALGQQAQAQNVDR